MNTSSTFVVYTDCCAGLDGEGTAEAGRQEWEGLLERIASRCQLEGRPELKETLISVLHELAEQQALYLGDICLNDGCCAAIVTRSTCPYKAVQPLFDPILLKEEEPAGYSYRKLGANALLIELTK